MSTSLLSRLSDNHPFNEEDDYPWVAKSYDSLLSELKMLLLSRARLPGLEDIPLVNASILNYGIDDSFKINEVNSQCQILESRLKNVISRFEPRLSQVSVVSNTDVNQVIHFIIQGFYLNTAITLELTWNDCTRRFDING